MFEDRVISLVTRSQIAEHEITQGVVPEVAARLHANVVFDVLDEALKIASIKLNDLEFISVTTEPGLVPSLLVGKTVAKTLAYSLDIPLISVHHIEGHIFANLLERSVQDLTFPAVVLTVSGGHNELYHWKSLFEWELLGASRDDAAGEAFDKVAKVLGLGFPGGPHVQRLALEYSGQVGGEFLFPVPLLGETSLDFSFSGLKSAVKRVVDERTENLILTQEDQREICYEFERSVIEVLTIKLFRATKQLGVRSIMLAGGVSANDALRANIASTAQAHNMVFTAPARKVYSMDNAAMIGVRAWYEYQRQNRSQAI